MNLLERIPLPAAAGLLSGLAIGLAACAVIQPGEARLNAASAPEGAPTAEISASATRPQLALAVPGPAHLVGLKGDAVRRTFGEPEMRRREPPAEVWQYRSPRCVLDLYFYGDPDGEGVVHYESRPRDQRQALSAPAPDGCVGELAGRKRPVV